MTQMGLESKGQGRTLFTYAHNVGTTNWFQLQWGHSSRHFWQHYPIQWCQLLLPYQTWCPGEK